MKALIASVGARPEMNRISFMVPELRSGKKKGGALSERVFVLFARADPNRRVEVVDEDLAVADLAGARGRNDRLDDLVGDVGVDRDFDFELGQETHRILRTAVD